MTKSTGCVMIVCCHFGVLAVAAEDEKRMTHVHLYMTQMELDNLTQDFADVPSDGRLLSIGMRISDVVLVWNHLEENAGAIELPSFFTTDQFVLAHLVPHVLGICQTFLQWL